MKSTYISISASIAIAGMILASCGSSDNNDNNTTAITQPTDNAVAATKVEFIGMDAPTINEPEKMAKTYSEAKVRLYTSDTEYKEYPLSYNVLFGVADKVGTNPNPVGQVYNHKMEPVMDPFGLPVIAETPDANSLLNVGGKLYMVSHLEYDWLLSNGVSSYKQEGWYSRMPMSMVLTDISQGTDGKLTAVDQKPIDFSGVNGGWIFCFGSQTPWNTHLGGEEDYDLYFTGASGDEAETTAAGLKAMSEVYFDNTKTANMYHYGYPVEVEVKADGNYNVTKHYQMGKGTWEMAKFMPDGKTVYYGDDGSYVLLMMFVGKEANNPKAGGTLYAAKWNQTNESGAIDGGKANLTWIKLGDAPTHATAETWANTYKFEDIFDYSLEAKEGYVAIKAGHSGVEYLKLKEGMENIAAVLEPRRLAAYKGATTEFNKMEGVALNAKDKKIYIAMSYIDKGMKADDSFAADHIKVAKNNCGGTYEVSLAGGQKDTNGNTINSEYVGTYMHVPSALLGEEIATDALGNTCHIDKTANTDNVFYSEKMRTLFIGEDSGTHVNNYVWAYNVDSKKLSRILSVVTGGEATGLQVIDNENGHAYIMSNSQHHADLLKTMPDDVKAKFADVKKIDAGDFGYIGGMPGIK
ncbi:MAG: DUF839 domain-containing protein [Campylobacterales bacterium]|nr:DUF839 domain-containing protein [Campylobacterales bacterium]